MLGPFSAAFTLLIAGALVFFLAAILMQEVRSNLVNVLLSEKSPLATEVSDWTVSGGELVGHYYGIKRGFIWGPAGNTLRHHQSTSALLRTARLLYVMREFGRFVMLAGFVWFGWCVFGP